MSVTWSDLNVRARGLGSHLLGRARLEALAGVSDLPALRVGLAAAGLPLPPEGAPAPTDLELAVRRHAARQVDVLIRWAGRRTRTLTIVLEDEDRRSLRALVRGALEGVAAERRLASLVPTPTLPERALMELARQPTVDALATLLVAWGNPYGAMIRVESLERRPDPLLLELAINRRFAERATRAARRGGRLLRTFVRRSIDLENAITALLLRADGDLDPGRCFLPGGDRLDLLAFEGAVSAATQLEAAERVDRAFAGTPFAGVFVEHVAGPERLEGVVLGRWIGALRRRGRLEPLGAAPLIVFLLRLRAQSMDLRRIIWGVALGAPAADLVRELMTPP